MIPLRFFPIKVPSARILASLPLVPLPVPSPSYTSVLSLSPLHYIFSRHLLAAVTALNLYWIGILAALLLTFCMLTNIGCRLTTLYTGCENHVLCRRDFVWYGMDFAFFRDTAIAMDNISSSVTPVGGQAVTHRIADLNFCTSDATSPHLVVQECRSWALLLYRTLRWCSFRYSAAQRQYSWATVQAVARD